MVTFCSKLEIQAWKIQSFTICLGHILETHTFSSGKSVQFLLGHPWFSGIAGFTSISFPNLKNDPPCPQEKKRTTTYICMLHTQETSTTFSHPTLQVVFNSISPRCSQIKMVELCNKLAQKFIASRQMRPRFGSTTDSDGSMVTGICSTTFGWFLWQSKNNMLQANHPPVH